MVVVRNHNFWDVRRWTFGRNCLNHEEVWRGFALVSQWTFLNGLNHEEFSRIFLKTSIDCGLKVPCSQFGYGGGSTVAHELLKVHEIYTPSMLAM